MISHYQVRIHRSGCIVGIFLFSLGLVSSHEVTASNYQNTPTDASTLKIEAKESEASIILGKDLVLGPPLSTKAPIIVNSSNFYDTASTKLDSSVTPTIVGRVSSGEHSGGNILRRAVSKDTGFQGSHIVDSHYSISKGPKAAWKKDSYLEALRHSHNSNDPREGIVRADSKATASRREYAQEPVYRQETEYELPGATYASKSPRITYGGPSDSYSQALKPSLDYNSVPQNPYGSLQNSYGPPRDGPSFYPQTSYGPPGNYLPSQQGYGPSIHTSAPTAVYGAPYALPDISHISILPNIDLGLPFALKLNAFTIAKILLKLIIFKMIVKFIAVICLLLFIPKLEIIKKKVSNKDDDDDNEERSLSSPYASSETLNNLEDVVKSSVEKYEAQNGAHSNSTEKCTTLACRITDALSFHESWNHYLNLFKNYVEEERHFTKLEKH